MGRGAGRLQGHDKAVRMSKPLSVETVSKLNVVLLRCATRAERNKTIRQAEHAEQLAREVAELCKELASQP
jgi:hypothetical protein